MNYFRDFHGENTLSLACWVKKSVIAKSELPQQPHLTMAITLTENSINKLSNDASNSNLTKNHNYCMVAKR